MRVTLACLLAALCLVPAAPAQIRTQVEGAVEGSRVTLFDGDTLLGATTAGPEGWAEWNISLPPGPHRLRTGLWHDPAANALSRKRPRNVLTPSSAMRQFARERLYPLSAPARAILAADFNSDGRADIAAATTNGILVRDATTAAYSNERLVFASPSISAFAAADCNADGHMDLVAATATRLIVLLGNGSGAFQPHEGAALPFAPTRLLVADLNGDAIPDLAAAGETKVAILHGAGDATFTPSFEIPIPSAAGALTAADFNNDLRTDLAVALPQRNAVLLLHNHTDRFSPSTEIPLDLTPAAIGVFEANGAAHLLARDTHHDQVRLFRATSDGAFDRGVLAPALTLDDPTGLHTDVNADGAPDRVFLATANEIAVAERATLTGVSITKSHTGAWTAGQTAAEFTIILNGTVPVGTEIVDVLPTGLTPIDAYGGGWEAYIEGQRVVAVPYATPDSSGNYPPLTIVVDVASDAPASMTNTVQVTDGPAASDTVVLGTPGGGGGGPAPDLTVSKTHTGNFFRGQTGALYTVNVSNSGSAAATNPVTLTEFPPPGLTVTSMSGTNWICNLPTLSCLYSGTVPASTGYPPVTVTVNVAVTAALSLTNAVSVSMTGDASSLNNSAFDSTTVQAPDLTVTKTHSGNFTQGQQNATFTVTVTNLGPIATIGVVTMGETINTGLVITAMTGAGWTCDVSAFTCTRSDALAPNSSYPPVTVTARVQTDAPPTVSNTALVFGGGDATNANNTSLDTAIVNPGYPDLTVTKTRNSPLQRGQPVTYIITVSNSGAVPSAGPITVTEIPPTGINVTNMSGFGSTCDVPNRTCTYNGSPLQPGGSYVVNVFASVANDAPSPLTNAVLVSGGGEINTSNNSAADVGAVTGIDLAIAKSHSGNFFRGQQDVAYTLTITNPGGATIPTGVRVTELPPTGMTVTSLSGTGWACNNTTLVCELGLPEFFGPITVRANIAADAPPTLTNTATVTISGDTNTLNNTANDVTTIGFIDLALTKTHTGTITRGQTSVPYTLTVANSGTAASTGTITVVEQPPAGLTVTALSGAGWNCTLANLTCTTTNAIAPGSPSTISVTAAVSATAPSLLTNQATLSGGGDSNSANNTATDASPVLAPDLIIVKTHSGNFFRGQTGAAYSLTVSNTGSGVSTGTVSVTEAPPAGLTVTAMSGGGWICTLQTLTCTTTASLAPSASLLAITVTVDVSATAPSIVTNNATVTLDADTNTANNSAADPTTIEGADLSISKSHSGNFTQGQNGATYSILVTNVGQRASAGNVTVTEVPPAGLTVTAMSGNGWVCALGTLSCTNSAALAANTSFSPIAVTVNVATNAASSLTNTATVGGGGDSNTSNNTANDVTTVASLPVDLTISKTHTGNFTRGQTGAVYTIRVGNVGTATSTTGIEVTEIPPPGMTITALSGPNWTCNLTTLVCTYGSTVPAGGLSGSLTVTASISPSIAANFNNTATVSGGGDTNTTNNTAIDPTTIGQPDVSIRKTHTGTFLPGSTSGAWTLEVTNVGTSPAIGTITVTEQPPAGYTVTTMGDQAVAGAAVCNVATLTCTLSEPLQAGQTRNIRVLGTTSTTAPATITNTATVNVTGGQELNTTNNTSTDTVTVERPDIGVAITHSGVFMQGQPGQFLVTVSNLGPIARPVIIRVEPPSNVDMTIRSFTSLSGVFSCDSPLFPQPFYNCRYQGDLQPGAVASFSISVDVGITAPPSSTMRIVYSGSSEETNTANNSAQDTVNIERTPAQLRLTWTDSNSQPWYQGTPRNVSLTVDNTGRTATSGLVTINLGATGANISALAGTGWACSVTTLTCSRSDSLGAYPTSSVWPTIVATVVPSALQVTLTAAANGGGSTPVNTQLVRAVLAANPDLTINKTANGAGFTTGRTGTYLISVTNSGTTPTLGTVTVTELPPAGLTIQAMSGSGWVCTTTPSVCTRGDTLPNGQSYPTITVTVAISGIASGVVSNTATVSGGGDTNLTNNSSTAVTPIIQAAYNVTFGYGVPAFNRVTGRWTQTVSIANAGIALTSSAIVLDNLPAGITLFNASGVTSAALPAGSPYREAGAIAAGAVVNVSLVFTVAPGSGPITYSARFLGPEPR